MLQPLIRAKPTDSKMSSLKKKGAGLHPRGEMWAYALITMLVILGPSVQDGQMGQDASSAFYFRLFLFGVIAVYGSIAVAVFDAFRRPSGIRQKLKSS